MWQKQIQSTYYSKLVEEHPYDPIHRIREKMLRLKLGAEDADQRKTIASTGSRGVTARPRVATARPELAPAKPEGASATLTFASVRAARRTIAGPLAAATG